MSEEEDGPSLFSVIAKFYGLIIGAFVGIPVYAILGAVLLQDYVLCNIVSLAMAYWIIGLGEHVVYFADSIRKWIRSGFSDIGTHRAVLDYTLKKRTKFISILLLANLLMLLLRFFLPQDYSIHQFTYFALRVFVLQGITLTIGYQVNRFIENIV